jgi:uncharacterized paraquat-inducible protein A
MATKKKAEVKVEAKPEVKAAPAKMPEDLVKCVNCDVMLPPNTGTCPNCSYRQPHPAWAK